MTRAEIEQLKADIVSVKDAIRKFAAGDRASEMWFADRKIKFAEISMAELQKELVRLQSLIPSTTGRVRTMRYIGL